MQVLWLKLLIVDCVVVVVVIDDVDDDGEDDDANDGVEWCLLCAFFPMSRQPAR